MKPSWWGQTKPSWPRGFALLGWVALPTLSYGAVHVLLVEAFDSGSKMGAATGAHVRPDAVIVGACSALTGLDVFH
jgi:hypothetical protein